MFESFSPLLHFNDEFLDGLNPSTDDDDVDDWLKPLSFDHEFDHDLQANFLNFNDIDIKQEEDKEKFHHTSIFHEDRVILNNYSHPQSLHESEFVDLYLPRSCEQRLPTTTTTTTTFRLIQQPKLEPTERPTTVFVNGNELQFHPIITTSNNHSNGKTIGHTYTSNWSDWYRETRVDSDVQKRFFDCSPFVVLLSYDIVPVNIHADPIIDTHRTGASIERKEIQTGWPSDSKRVRVSFDEGRSPLPPI